MSAENPQEEMLAEFRKQMEELKPQLEEGKKLLINAAREGLQGLLDSLPDEEENVATGNIIASQMGEIEELREQAKFYAEAITKAYGYAATNNLGTIKSLLREAYGRTLREPVGEGLLEDSQKQSEEPLNTSPGALNDYFSRVRAVMLAKPDWRLGQTHYNVLRQVRPDLADKVGGSSWYPFHNDDRVGEFLEWLNEHWQDEPNG